MSKANNGDALTPELQSLADSLGIDPSGVTPGLLDAARDATQAQLQSNLQGELTPEERAMVQHKLVVIDNPTALTTAISEQRANYLLQFSRSVARIAERYKEFVDITLLRDPKTIFFSNDYPFKYHFTWVPDGERKLKNDDVQRHQSLLLSQGYRPADLRTVEDDLVIGEDAVRLMIPQDSRFLEIKKRRKVDVPRIPNHLKNKFGFLVPPLVDRQGHVWVTPDYRLWWVETEIARQNASYDVWRANNGFVPAPQDLQRVLASREQPVFSGLIEANEENLLDFINRPVFD